MTKTKLSDLDDLGRRFVEASEDLLTIVDEDARFLYVNAAARRVFGIEPAECVGRMIWEFVHAEDRTRTQDAFRAWLRSRGPRSISFENRQVSRSGEVRHMLWTVVRQEDEHGGIVQLVSSARDVTNMKAIEQQLMESNLRLASITGGLLDPLLTIDPSGIIQDANAACFRAFGYHPSELMGANIKLLMPEPYRSEHDGYLSRFHQTGMTRILGQTREFPVLRKDGTKIECEVSISRIDIPGKGPLYCGSFRDVTAHKVAERALAESERRFRAIFDHEYEFVGLLSPDGTLLEVNRAALKIVGAERAEVVGKPFWETPWWSHSEDERERLKEAIGQAALGGFVRFETTHPRKGADLVTVDFSLKPFRDETGQIAFLLPEGRDITEIKLAQKRELAVMRALAEIGESASLLAHEIKNPITAVNTALRAVAKQLGENEQATLQDLVVRMQKLERLMRRTLSLARPIEIRPAPCDLSELLRSAAAQMKPHAEQARLQLEVRSPETVSLRVDASLLEEVLVNLIRNAIEAGTAGGRICLEVQPEGERLLIRVDDDGPGIPQSILPSLFKPFASTKAGGTGLGLALARKVIEAHRGTIDVHKSPLGGARFEIVLPRK